jgi:DNA-binding CsgD family transcriptional regulator
MKRSVVTHPSPAWCRNHRATSRCTAGRVLRSNAHGALKAPYETLTPREREVLHLAARGLTNREIATALFISPRTVETHRANLMRKLNLRTQADLIRFALQRGLLPIDPKCPKLLPLSTLQSTRWGQRKTRLHLGSVAGRRFDGDLTSDD